MPDTQAAGRSILPWVKPAGRRIRVSVTPARAFLKAIYVLGRNTWRDFRAAYEANAAAYNAPDVALPGLSGEVPSPIADREAAMMEEQGSDPGDIPYERTLYRGSDGKLYTSSMIARGMGAGLRMMYAANTTPVEDENFMADLESISLDAQLTEWERELLAELKKERAKKWL